MSEQFQCTIDDEGNISVRSGWVINLLSGQMIEVVSLPMELDEFPGAREFRKTAAAKFLGGGGNNLVIAEYQPGVPVAEGFPVGVFRPEPETTGQWISAHLPAAAITLQLDGSASITDGVDAVAVAAMGTFVDVPIGTFESTVYGHDTYNGGDPFSMEVTGEGEALTAGFPVAGDVYVVIYETASGSGVIDEVRGPFFGEIPTGTAVVYPVLLARSDGLGNLQQYQDGPIFWNGVPAPVIPADPPIDELLAAAPAACRTALGLGGLATMSFVSLTSAEYLALDPPDPDTIYDITDAVP